MGNAPIDLTILLLSRLEFRVQARRVSGVPDVVSRHCHEPAANDHYSLWRATSSLSTRTFLPIVTLVLLSVILMYTA
jgi:cytochrome bd-type quinol oxidase subunit 2